MLLRSLLSTPTTCTSLLVLPVKGTFLTPQSLLNTRLSFGPWRRISEELNHEEVNGEHEEVGDHTYVELKLKRICKICVWWLVVGGVGSLPRDVKQIHGERNWNI